MTANRALFHDFFQGKAKCFLLRSIDMALEEDGPDWTSQALFASQEQITAQIISKQSTLCAGLPLIQIILDRIDDCAASRVQLHIEEGDEISSGSQVATIFGEAGILLKAERIILNYISHLSGIANNTRNFVAKMQESKTRLLDTRKTLPGLRYPEKYAVRLAGGFNHRFNLHDMLMLKDNHIDRVGSITKAVNSLRNAYSPCPPIEVECRNKQDVLEAVNCQVERIMLDNMSLEEMKSSLLSIPEQIETEISGGVTLENISSLAQLGADYISVGCLTNSAPTADFSMNITLEIPNHI